MCRPKTGPLLAALGAGAAAVAAVLGVGLAAPDASRAATGVFLFTDGSGLTRPLAFPAGEKCFDTFGAAKAQNFTDSDAVLSADGLCSDFLMVVKPGESAEAEFGSVGFTPPGAVEDE